MNARLRVIGLGAAPVQTCFVGPHLKLTAKLMYIFRRQSVGRTSEGGFFHTRFARKLVRSCLRCRYAA
jgi:hypothetical protein